MSKTAVFCLAAVILLCIAAIPAIAADTTAPVIGAVTATPGLVAAGDSVHVIVSVTDDTSVTGVSADQIGLSATNGSNWEGDIPASSTLGEHTVAITAADAAGNSATVESGYYSTLPVIGINNQSALDSIISHVCSTYLFRVWGKAQFIDENTFSVCDGSRFPITVIAPGHNVANNDYVWARGILDILHAPPAVIGSAQYSILKMAPRKAITVYDVIVGKDLQVSDYGSLPAPVAYGTDLKVTISSSDPSRVQLAKDNGAPGNGTIVLTVPGGSSTIPTFYVYGLAGSGTVDVNATAPGGYGKTFKVTLMPSGFVISTGNIGTTTFTANSNITIRPARLNPTTLAYGTYQPLRAGMSNVSVDVLSSNTSVGTITNSPLAFNANVNYLNAQFDPANAGTSTISISTPAGFSTPSNYQSITATVTAPDITASDANIGKDLQTSSYCYLGVAPPEPVDITVTVEDPSVAAISKDVNTEGSGSITFSAVSNTNSQAFYVQGLSLGTTTLTVSAPGFNTATKTIKVDPSGFIFSTSNIGTTTFSANSNITIRPARLDPTTLAYGTYQPLRAGMSGVSVDVLSSNTSVGTITNSPLAFNANVNYLNAQFDPANAGMSTISISTPAGFSTPSNYQSITATVTAPDITASDANIGKDLQTSSYCYLGAAPPEPVDITVTVEDPSVAAISKDVNTEGSGSITFSAVSNTNSQAFYVQGLSLGTTTLTVSAPGFNTATKTIKVDPSGFVFSTGNISTTTISSNYNITIRPARLNPTTLAYGTYQPLRAGMSGVSVDVLSSNTSVGTITNSPLAFNTNVNYLNAQFDPANAGTSTISISTPAGFSTPSNYQSITATVTAPDIVSSDANIGKDLQASSYCYLSVAPPAPLDVTVTVEDPSIAIISKSATAVGFDSLTFSAVSNTNSQAYYVQGLKIGTTKITASASGYKTILKTITVDPSGFVISSPASIVTTVSAGNTNVSVKPARLNPSNFTYSTPQPLRGGIDPVTVSVTSSNDGVGIITTTPLVFNGGVNYINTQFDPLAVGTTSISIDPPIGFSTPTTSRVITATVN